MMNERGRSDSAIVATKPANKAEPSAAESVEPRAGSNEHGHSCGLARTGGQFQRETHQFGVGISVGRREMIKQTLPILGFWCHLGQRYRGFHRLDLTEEWDAEFSWGSRNLNRPPLRTSFVLRIRRLDP
jgi:hypothetical protein